MMNYLDVINFWFSEKSEKHWFNSTPEIDAEIKKKFEGAWQSACTGELDAWQETAEGALALIIILDQFPLNMFRAQVKSFETEKKAIAVALRAITSGFDKQLRNQKLRILLMPLTHSENLKDQELSFKLCKKYALRGQLASMMSLRFVKHHRNLIKEFGRFPHRNAILGRESTLEEIEYLASDRAFKG